MAKIGMQRATEIVNDARAKLNKPDLDLRSVRTLLKRNKLPLTYLTPSYLEVEETALVAWIDGGGLRNRGRPRAKTKTV